MPVAAQPATTAVAGIAGNTCGVPTDLDRRTGTGAVDGLLRLEPRPQEDADEAEAPSLSPVTADRI